MGLMVDSVNQTVELSEDDIEATPTFGTLARSEYLLGMGRVDKKFVLLLNIDRALSSDALQVAHARVELPAEHHQTAEAGHDG
jgi:purine-binding chemotaxis protein CheW